MPDTKEDVPGLAPGIGVLIDPDRLLGTTIEQNAPYFITVKGLRIYGRNPPNVIDNAIKMNSSEFNLSEPPLKQAQTAIGVNKPSFMSKVKGALSTAGTTLKKGAVSAGKAAKKGAAAAGTAIKKGAVVAGKAAVVAGTAIKKGAIAAGKVAKKGAVATGKAAVVAGTAIKKGAIVAGTAAKKGAVATGKAVKKGAVATGKAVKGLTAKKPPPNPTPNSAPVTPKKSFLSSLNPFAKKPAAGGGTRKKRKPSKRARAFTSKS